MIRPVSGPFVVHADDHLIEVVARGAGPAGAIGVELFDGAVSLDLDGADVNQLVAIRFPLTGGVSTVQRSFIEEFFGNAADDILTAASGRRPSRVGARRRAATSNDIVEVDPQLALLVVGADTLHRFVSTPATEALLALETLTAATATGIALDRAFRAHCEQALLNLPRTFPVPGLDKSYQESLSRAVAAGVLSGPPSVSIPPLRKPLTKTSIPLGDLIAYSRFEGIPAGVSALPFPDNAPRIKLDPLSLLRDDVTWLWAGNATLRVSTPACTSDETLWVRLRAADGTVLAASPLRGHETNRREAHLLVIPRDGLILDIVSEVAARVLDDRVAAIARAVECGQRAGRLERLGALDDAALAWEECAAWHRVVGDAPREKLAMVRGESPSGAAPTLIDALLENRSPLE